MKYVIEKVSYDKTNVKKREYVSFDGLNYSFVPTLGSSHLFETDEESAQSIRDRMESEYGTADINFRVMVQTFRETIEDLADL